MQPPVEKEWTDSPAEPKLLTVRESASLLRVSESTLFNYTKRGLIPVVRIGNTIRVADNHYLQVTESDFEKAAQKAAQYPAVTVHTGSKPDGGNPQNQAENQADTTPYDSAHGKKVAATGLEPVTRGL